MRVFFGLDLDDAMSTWARHLTSAEQEALVGWVQRIEAGMNPADAERLEVWLAASVYRRQGFEALRETWADPDMELALAASEVSPLLMRQGLASPRMTRRVIMGAAAMTVPAAIGGVLWSSQRPRFEATFTTARSATRQVDLPDGSQLALNAMTRVSVRWGPAGRRLVLDEGEAFLSLASGPPMVWLCEELRIEATACEINLNRLPGAYLVAVAAGAATLAFGRRNLVLGAGQAVEATASRGFTRQQVPTPSQSWRSGWLDVSDAPLGTVVAQLARYGSKPVRIPDAGLADKSVAGRFALDRFSENLTVLAALCDFRIDDSGPAIVLHPGVADVS